MRRNARTKKTVQKIRLKPIEEIAKSVGITKKFLEPYGLYKSKVSLEVLKSLKRGKSGKYDVVTSLTPSFSGEGKTLTAIGLSMAFKKLKKKAIACILQPSLGGVFGIKGSATGSGLSQVLPFDEVNLHFTGDMHAVEIAHNLCASYLDNSVFKGNPLDIDIDAITWRRVADTNDRSLRNVNIGLGGKSDGITRKTGFEPTASSELMSILSLAENIKDVRERIEKITLGFTKKGKPLTCEDIKVSGSITALLRDALKPNLVQTTEHTPCFMHMGSHGDTALGFGSIVADRIALGFCDYVVTETSFGADLGAEKFFNIKCRAGNLKPDAAILVCTTRALKMHSGDFDVTTSKFPRELFRENISALERGLSNLEKQIENIRTFDVPVVVCINRFADDTEKEIEAIRRRVVNLGAHSVAVSDAWSSGGQGAVELAEAVMEACTAKHNFRFLYPVDLPIKDKIRRIAKTIYGAKDVVFSEEVNKKALFFRKLKLDNVPVCIAKTHFSLSHNPKRKGRPHGFRFPIDDIRLHTGGGYVTAFSSNIKMIPGLPKIPRGAKITVDDEGRITGLS